MRCSGPDLDRLRFGVIGETDSKFVVDSSTVGGAGVGQHSNDIPELFDEVTDLGRCHALVLGPERAEYSSALISGRECRVSGCDGRVVGALS